MITSFNVFKFVQCGSQALYLQYFKISVSIVIDSVIHRMVVLLFERATIEANHTAMLAQAQNVSKELERRLEEVTKTKDKVRRLGTL